MPAGCHEDNWSVGVQDGRQLYFVCCIVAGAYNFRISVFMLQGKLASILVDFIQLIPGRQ
jgi:hypothetical protein